MHAQAPVLQSAFNTEDPVSDQPAADIAQPVSIAAPLDTPPTAPAPVPVETTEVAVAEAHAEEPQQQEPPPTAAVQAPRVRRQRPAVSDDTLAAWQAKLMAKQQAQRAAAEASARRRAQADAFRVLRTALRELDRAADAAADAPHEALAADALAARVHAAPEHVRAVIASTLDLMLGRRRGRPASR